MILCGRLGELQLPKQMLEPVSVVVRRYQQSTRILYRIEHIRGMVSRYRTVSCRAGAEMQADVHSIAYDKKLCEMTTLVF